MASRKPPLRRRLHICLSVDFDAISGYLGTGHDPKNTLADYSAGIFSAHVGVPRLLKIFEKHGVSDKITWFLPGHSIETFPDEALAIIKSGAEIGLHGYSHEGAYAMTQEQEKDVLEKCISIVSTIQGGRKPVGYRAPLYQIRETTVRLLQEKGFLYDSSMNAHDSMPYTLPNPFPTEPPRVPDYTQNAKSWMVPTSVVKEPAAGTAEARNGLIEIPSSWYTEDMTPLGFYPYTPNSQGYVAVDVVEKMWWDRFDWLWDNECFVQEGEFGSIYPMVWHPESAGRAHVVGMIDRFVSKLVHKMNQAGPSEITFETMETMSHAFKARKA
jgi:peptidoglycan/xylan/chitin deacetylase (PgdA/CDA1 family)